MLSFNIRNALTDLLDLPSGFIYCGCSKHGYTLLYQKVNSKIRFFSFTYNPSTLVQVCECPEYEAVTDAYMSPDQRFLSFTSKGETIVVIDFHNVRGDPVIFEQTTSAIPIGFYASKTYYLCEKNRDLFMTSIVKYEDHSKATQKWTRVASSVNWWEWVDFSEHFNCLAYISKKKFTIEKWYHGKFSDHMEFSWNDSWIPTHFFVLSPEEFLVTSVTPSEIIFLKLPCHSEIKIDSPENYNYSQLSMCFISKTLLVTSIPGKIVAIIDLVGDDIHSQVFLERDIVRFSVPSFLVETSFDGRVFFCPESLAFFSVDYNDSEMLQSLLSKTDKWGYIGHLIGSHTPFMELAQETFEFAATLRRPFQMFELACHFLISNISLSGGANSPLKQFVSHYFTDVSEFCLTESEVLSVLQSIPECATMKPGVDMDNCNDWCPEGFWRMSIVYNIIRCAVYVKRNRVVIPMVRVPPLHKHHVSNLVPQVVDTFFAKFLGDSVFTSAATTQFLEQYQSGDVANRSIVTDLGRGLVHFIAAKELHFPFSKDKLKLIQKLAIKGFPEITTLMLSKYEIFQFPEEDDREDEEKCELWMRCGKLAQVKKEFVPQEVVGIQLFDPYNRFLLSAKGSHNITDYGVDNLRAIYG